MKDKEIGKKVLSYKGNDIYDRGEKSGMKYRFYARQTKPYPGYDLGYITANGNSIKEIKSELIKP